MKPLFRYLIRLYRRYVSPALPPTCRFIPTCSEYALEAFKKKSAFTAAWMTIRRILKCHPFHPGGYDPVEPLSVSVGDAPLITRHPVVPPSRDGRGVNSVRDKSSLTSIDRGVLPPSPGSEIRRQQ